MATVKQTSPSSAVALIVAAGRGARVGSRDGASKQYLDLGGRAVLAWSIEAFAAHPGIASIQVVIHPDDAERFEEVLAGVSPRAVDKVLRPVMGADSRQGSTFRGLQALQNQHPDAVLIHDAARPFLSYAVIDALLTALPETKGVLPALAVADTLKRADEAGTIEATVARDGLWQAQTPQAFWFDTIVEAHTAARQSDRKDFTDDASILEANGETVKIVPGDANLRKITNVDDLTWARRHSSMDGYSIMETRVGQGFDVHAFADGDHVVLCGVRIPHDKTLKGHSDADVGLHALTDAILGALGDGDIGTHFPPSEAKWRGADSTIFLEDAVRRVDGRRGRIVHVDVTLICENPKIGPHRDAMVTRLRDILGVGFDRISIKATTTERLGFTGRGEGIAALATATIAVPANVD